jgi:hypothetical protein
VTRIVDDCAAIALAGLADDIATHFADDPLGTLRHDLNLTVRAVGHLDDSRADGGVCDGVSYLSDGVILYRTTGNRRENFTLAHELGHWLVDQADDVYDRLADLDDAAKLLESVCDQIARLLLLPDSRLASVVPSTVVEAKHVTDLYDATNASIHACVIALKDRLPNMGAVLVIRHREDEVLYASIRPDDELGWPKVYPWPGQTLPSGHPLRSLRAGRTLRQRSFWTMPWGDRADFYLDAVADSRRTIAILSADDLWQAEQFHPADKRDYDQRPELEVYCCGELRKFRGWPCSTCGKGYCPICGNCQCQKQIASEVLCAGSCFMQYLPHLLDANGLCEECR